MWLVGQPALGSGHGGNEDWPVVSACLWLVLNSLWKNVKL